ncbi:MAG TPA: glycine betaine ABC transporter substrate-binding protein [Fimbriimonadaceae bacterium]|jgi:osmoprotectant transport system permease protein
MKRFLLFLLAIATSMAMAQDKQQVTVGSKKFTESYVLGNLAKRQLEKAGFDAQHKQGIGATSIVWQALKSGDIDLYPEYTGTISEEILKSPHPLTDDEITAALKPDGIGISKELGFDDTYALVMRKDQADQLGIHSISDLKGHSDLKIELSHEFLKRKDGWEPLCAKYGLNFPDVQGIDHGIAYTALKSKAIDLTDAYSTDAQIGQFNLTVLKDNLNFFPKYRALYLYRLNMPQKAVDAINALAGKIDEPLMIKMNVDAEKTKDFDHAAAIFFKEEKSVAKKSIWGDIAKNTARHLQLVGISMLLALIIGIPLGIWAAKPGLTSQMILGFTGMVQTIPSLALLALLVPLIGIQTGTAILALFLYSLLPIVRNTAAGLQSIPASFKESAEALGLEPFARLTQIYLPMASRTILAGVKTSVIINIGTATLAALIAQGGLGDPIIAGLALNDTGTILQGAIPAAVLALVAGWVFDLLDLALIPKGLRLNNQSA